MPTLPGATMTTPKRPAGIVKPPSADTAKRSTAWGWRTSRGWGFRPMMPRRASGSARRPTKAMLPLRLALGTMYCLGRGVARSEEHARTWFAKAACPDDRRAADALEWLDLRKKPPVAGRFAYLKIAHISQGWNMCGVAAATMATAFHGKTADQYEVKRLCGSPMGEGTDWMDIVSAAAKLGCHWELVTFPNDRAGLDVGRTRMMAWLDAGHPILLDITVEPPGRSPTGHTVVLVGYDAAGERWIIDNPALGRRESSSMTCRPWTDYGTRGGTRKSPLVPRPIILTR